MVRPVKVALCSLVLNEEEFLSKNYEQHKDWPGLVSWIFVEAADVLYGQANPGMVSSNGLSIDCTSTILEDLQRKDKRVVYEQYGWMRDGNQAQAKTKGRDRYLAELENVNPDFFVVIDADEFYTYTDQARINGLVAASDHYCYRLTQRHLWRPPAIAKASRFEREVVGGYWTIRHTRIFRWKRGLKHRHDHNYPQSPGYNPLSKLYEGTRTDPECVHLGFTRDPETRLATNQYYKQRGEGQGDGRDRYVACRAAWETWKPGMNLPAGAKLLDYTGPIPECYK